MSWPGQNLVRIEQATQNCMQIFEIVADVMLSKLCPKWLSVSWNVRFALASTYGHMHISKISFLRVATQSGLICQCICCAQIEPQTTCPRSCPVYCDSSLPSAGAVEQVRGIYLWQWQVYVSFAIRRIVQIYVSLFSCPADSSIGDWDTQTPF